MPATLLLRLSGPMQSWGTDSRFDIRDTRREPSKSGVNGLLCAALGKPRFEVDGDGHPRLADLAQLRMGVRIDREGKPAVDYHTAGGTHCRGEKGGVPTASGKAGQTVQSWRHYLADADFLVGLEGERELLNRLGSAIESPVWQLCLGRKAFVPARPIHLPRRSREPNGLVECGLEEALARIDWPLGQTAPLRAVFEVPYGAHSDVRQDVPIDFAARRFGIRYVDVRFLERQES